MIKVTILEGTLHVMRENFDTLKLKFLLLSYRFIDINAILFYSPHNFTLNPFFMMRNFQLNVSLSIRKGISKLNSTPPVLSFRLYLWTPSVKPTTFNF